MLFDVNQETITPRVSLFAAELNVKNLCGKQTTQLEELIVNPNGRIDRLQLTSPPPCWMTINKRIIISFIVPVIQHGRQGLCCLNLTGMVANHLLIRTAANFFFRVRLQYRQLRRLLFLLS